jgi:AcrR family transcriptional regulator
MVQNTEPRRGRPRAYDPATALAQAMAAFWDAGYAATSLDDLAAATGMNRPSLYGAFGDKRALYRQAIAAYRANARQKLAAAFAADGPLADALGRVYKAALASYLEGAVAPRGCFMIGTAVTEAVLDPAVREDLAGGLREIDQAFEARLRRAQDAGELPADADPVALGRLASAVLYFMAIRARAGEPRAVLEAAAQAGIALICGNSMKRPPRHKDTKRPARAR